MLYARLGWFSVSLALLILWRPSAVVADDAPARQAEMAGYLLVPHGKVPEKYNAGFSMYVAAWPLLKAYPGQNFQSGLFGTWMFAQFDGKSPKNHYSDIEGGLGWWRDTRFATETPKFIMGGVALNFCEWANGPGAGKGRDWKKPQGHYAVAQLSPWVLWPPDGLNLKQGAYRGTLRVRLPAAAAHDAQEDHRGKGRPDREPLLDPVPQHRQLQRAGDVLPAVFLVASLRREPASERSVPRLPAVRAEQGVADGDPAHPRVPRQGREGRHLRPNRPHDVPGATGR